MITNEKIVRYELMKAKFLYNGAARSPSIPWCGRAPLYSRKVSPEKTIIVTAAAEYTICLLYTSRCV